MLDTIITKNGLPELEFLLKNREGLFLSGRILDFYSVVF